MLASQEVHEAEDSLTYHLLPPVRPLRNIFYIGECIARHNSWTFRTSKKKHLGGRRCKLMCCNCLQRSRYSASVSKGGRTSSRYFVAALERQDEENLSSALVSPPPSPRRPEKHHPHLAGATLSYAIFCGLSRAGLAPAGLLLSVAGGLLPCPIGAWPALHDAS